MEKKQTTDTAGVITRSETVFGKFLLKQVHTCTARSIFLGVFLLIFLPSAQISHILRSSGASPDLKYTEDEKKHV